MSFVSMLPNIYSYSFKTKLFVGRLPEGCTSKDLDNLFRKYGNVIECDVVGKFGFVHMNTRQEAEECVKKLNKYNFMGSQLSVEFSTSKVHPQPGTTGRAKGPIRLSRKIERTKNGLLYTSHKSPPHNRNAYAFSSYYAEDYKLKKDFYHDRDSYRSERLKSHYSPYDRRSVTTHDNSQSRKLYSYNNRSAASNSPPDNIYARRPTHIHFYNRRNDISTPMYSTQSPQHSGYRSSSYRSSSNWIHSGLDDDYANRRSHRYNIRKHHKPLFY